MSARLINLDGTIDNTWHPLDGVPAPDYIPATWDGPHVSKRLVEALRVLFRLPMPPGPKVFGNAWPAYSWSWEDQLAQEERDQAEKSQDAFAQNRVKLLPSAVEIMHMETAIVWPARYLGEFPQLLVTVGCVALARSRYRDIEFVARRLRLPPHVVRRWNRDGLDLIACGLRKHSEAIF